MSKRHDFVQLFRFVAALAVCLFHQAAFYRQAGGYAPAADAMALGWLGVDIFFVISGYVMVAGSTHSGSALDFLIRRVARIFPPLWIATAIFLLLSFVAGQTFDFGNALRSITLIDSNPIPSRHALYVTWSLSYEMLFYLIFSLYIFVGKRWPIAFFLFAIIGIQMLRLTPSAPPILTNASLYAFMIGCCAGAATSRSVAYQPIIFAAGLIGISFGIYATAVGQYTVWPVSIGTACVIYGSRDLLHGRWARVSNHLGNTSYALYLLHPSIITLLSILGLRWELAAHSPLAAVTFYAVASCAAAFAFWRFIERGLTKTLVNSLTALTARRQQPQRAVKL